MKETKILGVKINVFKNRDEVLALINNYLGDIGQHYIVTANAEIILEAQTNEEFFYILRKSDINLIDGSGPQIASVILDHPSIRYAGADLTLDILKIAENTGKKVLIFTWNKGLSRSDEITAALKKLFPGLQSLVLETGRDIDLKNITEINNFSPDILFAALGAPWQEKIIYHSLKKYPSVKLALGIGGSLDFITGKIKRAPIVLRTIGLEWIWRLFKQPWRWKRIINATIIFPYKFLIWRFIYPYVYRNNTAIILFKKQNENIYILLVKRNDGIDHWQLPQGGNDGLNVVDTGIKELSEELNCPAGYFKPIKFWSNLYKYSFYSQNDIKTGKYQKNEKHNGYKGQKQNLLVAEFIGNENDIKINFWDHDGWKWINSEKFIDEVHPVRQTSAKIFYKKFREILNNKE